MTVLLEIASFLGSLIARIFVGAFVGAFFGAFGAQTTRSAKGSLEEMVRRFPRSVVLRCELVTWPGISQADAATVRFVVGGQAGLSFRDAYGWESIKLAGKEIGLERVDTAGTSYLRARLDRAEPIDFWIDGTSQEDALAALAAVLAPTPRLGP